MSFLRTFLLCALVALSAFVMGCGSSLSAVSGKVSFNGKPVTAGTVTFSPISDGTKEPGKPASGIVQPDGTFQLGTNSGSDGAIVGKHKVTFFVMPKGFPEGYNPKPGESPKPTGFEGLVPKQAEVEVKSGGNTIEIELVKPKL